MDKTADHINRQTLKFSNKIYEELSTIVCQREDLRYFNYDINDEKIDYKLERMFELLDDIYNLCIEKKTGWISKKSSLKSKKILFPDENLPSKIKTPIEYLGHISSSYHSPNLNHCISMAMIKSGNKLMGKKLFVSTPNGTKNIPVEIVNPVFIDPENKRLTS